MMEKLYLLIIILILNPPILGSKNIQYKTEIQNKNFASLSVTNNGDWNSPPIIKLESADKIIISFDCLAENLPDSRLQYKVKYCNFDWTENSTIFENEYLEGFNNIIISDYHNSINTTVPYTHYKVEFPNSNMSPTLPGNYMIEVYDEENQETILTACFYVIDPNSTINAVVSSHTTIDNNKSNQQLDFDVSYSFNAVNPQQDFKIIVKQNNREDNKIVGVSPNFHQPQKLIFKNNKQLTFLAGNEFLRFDSSNKQLGGLNITDINYQAPFYHIYIKPDKFTNSYHFDQTQLGKVIYRIRDRENADTEADYFYVHFTLSAEEDIPIKNVFINGDFTYHDLSPKHQLKYNKESNEYQLSLLLKQGLYNYQYLIQDKFGKITNLQGDFYQTNNLYSIYVYYHDRTKHIDKLVGFKEIATK